MKIVEWPETLTIDGPVLVEVIDNVLWVSTDQKTVSSKPIKEVDSTVWQVLQMATVVAYDIKEIYHAVAEIKKCSIDELKAIIFDNWKMLNLL